MLSVQHIGLSEVVLNGTSFEVFVFGECGDYYYAEVFVRGSGKASQVVVSTGPYRVPVCEVARSVEYLLDMP